MILKDYTLLSDGEIDIQILNKSNGDKEKGRCPEYKFQILIHSSQTIIGHINLRFGNDDKILNYIGHIGYGINENFRGNKYSQKACELVKRVLIDHDINKVIITCNPDNFASIRICEELGAELLEIVDTKIYSETEPYKCKYEWMF